MAREPVELSVAVHFDPPEGKAVLVSDTGDAARAVWLPGRLLTIHEHDAELRREKAQALEGV